jgi:hypothetical protein
MDEDWRKIGKRMSSVRRIVREEDPVVVRLESGHYDRELAQFRDMLDQATEELRRIYAAMRDENTPRS